MTSRPTEEQLRLPIDQFQRHWLTTQLVGRLLPDPEGTVLDVGGAPGPVEMFLPRARVCVVDTQGTHDGGRYVLGSGARLPFDDDAFDAVVSLDTLEHVPGEIRADFLSELRRVSRDAVVLSAPFDEPGVAAAEAALLDFISQRLAPSFPTAVWLTEHRDLGLPGLAATREGLGGRGARVAALPSGYLPRWLATMIADHELLATGLRDMGSLHAYYNEHVSPLDAVTPAYRHIVVSSLSRSDDELDDLLAGFRAPEGAHEAAGPWLSAMSTAVLQHRLAPALASSELDHERAETARLTQRVVDLERVLADRDAALHALRERTAHLERLSDLLARSPARAAVSRARTVVHRLTSRSS